jgi:hypothetical protein
LWWYKNSNCYSALWRWYAATVTLLFNVTIIVYFWDFRKKNGKQMKMLNHRECWKYWITGLIFYCPNLTFSCMVKNKQCFFSQEKVHRELLAKVGEVTCVHWCSCICYCCPAGNWHYVNLYKNVLEMKIN